MFCLFVEMLKHQDKLLFHSNRLRLGARKHSLPCFVPPTMSSLSLLVPPHQTSLLPQPDVSDVCQDLGSRVLREQHRPRVGVRKQCNCLEQRFSTCGY